MDGEFSMLTWHEWNGTEESWDALLRVFPDDTVYQSYRWGMHKAHSGWRPIRLVGRNGSTITSMVQLLVKYYPFSIGVVWIPGGPLGDIDSWGFELQRMIEKAAGVRFLYCRFNSMLPFSTEDELKLRASGWRRTAYPLLSGLSLLYQPMLSESECLKLCSGNWRHNLRRSGKRNLRVYLWRNPDIDEMVRVYDVMQSYKKLNPQTSREEIKSMIDLFTEQCVLVRCDDEYGNLLSFRGALLYGDKAWDIFAATTPAGRNVYASHASFWELMKQCKERYVQWYDMGGADAVNNPGVYDFKKGTGATDLKYLGEWEYSSPRVMSSVANYLISRKGHP